jgi:hypothetical protein
MKSYVSFAGVLCIALLLALIVPANAQRQYEFTPSVSVSGTYDDNIFLSPGNEVDDYITSATPSLALSILTQHTDLALRYAPTFVWYDDRDDLDTTRHLGNVTWGQQLTEHFRFDLTDTYLESDDPLEDELDVQGIRRTRNKYWVNTGRAGVGYVFGAENTLDLGYSREDRENDEVTLDDSTAQTPFANLTYWFNVKNGIELTYSYTDVEYSRNNNVSINDDYTGHQPGVRYIRRFNPHSRGYVGYSYATRDFDGITEDYVVHDGYVGLEHAFSPQYSVSARAGYFIQVNDVSEEDQDGPTFTASLTRDFARGNITIGGEGGWEEEYLARGFGRTSGFTEYYGGYARITYKVLEPVNIFAGGSYRHDKDELNIRSDVVRANGGFTWRFLRWFSLTVSYTYADRNDDIESESYTDNRVTATLTAAKPFRW